MSKAKRYVEIPDDLADALKALAKASGKTQERLISDMLKENLMLKVMQPWIKNGVFDKRRFRRDCKHVSAGLKKWDKDNADEVERILALGQPVIQSMQ